MKNEQGSVLLISLVLLLILTIVGVASIGGVTMNEKMTVSQRDYDIAFELAEAALVQGERWLDDYDVGFSAADLNEDCVGSTCWTENCTNGLCFRGEHYSDDDVCVLDVSGTPVWDTETIWDNNSAQYSENVVAVEKPRILIEFLCYTPIDVETEPTDPPPYNNEWRRIYRITSLAYGTHPQTRVMLQSTYRVD